MLRAFELVLLRELGHLPDLRQESATLSQVNSVLRYTLVADGGLRQAAGYERAALSGLQWQSIELALQAEQPFPRTLNALSEPEVAQALKPQLRHLLQYHCGSTMLRTRQLMMDLQSL